MKLCSYKKSEERESIVLTYDQVTSVFNVYILGWGALGTQLVLIEACLWAEARGKLQNQYTGKTLE